LGSGAAGVAGVGTLNRPGRGVAKNLADRVVGKAEPFFRSVAARRSGPSADGCGVGEALSWAMVLRERARAAGGADAGAD